MKFLHAGKIVIQRVLAVPVLRHHDHYAAYKTSQRCRDADADHT
ncbi:hypothetical protein [Glaciimonas sp. PCH181]|nr:hypothetical protein [Glaciimonas sp. PCH181]